MFLPASGTDSKILTVQLKTCQKIKRIPFFSSWGDIRYGKRTKRNQGRANNPFLVPGSPRRGCGKYIHPLFRIVRKADQITVDILTNEEFVLIPRHTPSTVGLCLERLTVWIVSCPPKPEKLFTVSTVLSFLPRFPLLHFILHNHYHELAEKRNAKRGRTKSQTRNPTGSQGEYCQWLRYRVMFSPWQHSDHWTTRCDGSDNRMETVELTSWDFHFDLCRFHSSWSIYMAADTNHTNIKHTHFSLFPWGFWFESVFSTETNIRLLGWLTWWTGPKKTLMNYPEKIIIAFHGVVVLLFSSKMWHISLPPWIIKNTPSRVNATLNVRFVN